MYVLEKRQRKQEKVINYTNSQDEKNKREYLDILYNNDNDKDGLSEEYVFGKDKYLSNLNNNKSQNKVVDNYFSEEDFTRLKNMYGINLFDTLVDRKLVK
jgi:hypothetical protein